jgi:hypothetical protein
MLFKNPVRTSKRTPHFTITKINWLTVFKFKNPVRTSKRTPHFTITKINWLTLLKEIIVVCSENHAKPINTKCSVTDCQSVWFIKLPLGLKGLMKLWLCNAVRTCNNESVDK